MKVYVLVAIDEQGKPSFDMPTYFHRTVRAYTSKKRAQAYAKKFDCKVIELDISQGRHV